MRRVLRWSAGILTLAGVVAVTVVAGAGARVAPVAARTQLGTGLSIVVPASWHVAPRLTSLAEPYERFTLASFALHRPSRGRLDCGPSQAVDTIPSDGALAFVVEYRRDGASRQSFPPQPKRFALPPGPARQYECFPLGWLLHFRVGTRPFQVMIALGPHAGPNRARLLRALSSLRVASRSGSG